MSVQKVAEQSIKDSLLCLFYNFFKTKTEQNKPYHLFYEPFPSPGLSQPTGPYPSIGWRAKFSRQVTATTQASHQRHIQQQQGKSQLAARPAAGDRGYKSEGETTHERPKFDGIRAGKKN